jgi:hypothetical protein
MAEKLFCRIAFSSLVTGCWIHETASNLVPLITDFNLGKKPAGAKSGEWGAWDNTRILVSPETGYSACALSCRRYQDHIHDTDAMHSSDQSLHRDAVNIVSHASFAFSRSELSVSLDSTILHSDVLFVNRTRTSIAR